MRIGSDELILWLRKNKKAVDISNEIIGKKIRQLIEGLDGKLVAKNTPSRWNKSKNIDRHNLPKTSAQYEIDFDKVNELYEELNKF